MKSEDGADAKKRPEKEAWRAKKEAEPKEAAESAVKMKTEEETTANLNETWCRAYNGDEHDVRFRPLECPREAA